MKKLTDKAFVSAVRVQLRRLDLDPKKKLEETLAVFTTLIDFVEKELKKPDEKPKKKANGKAAAVNAPDRIVLPPEQVEAPAPSNGDNAQTYWRRILGFSDTSQPGEAQIKSALPGALTRHPDVANFAYKMAKVEMGIL